MCPLLVLWGVVAHWVLVTVVGPAYGAGATPWRILLIGELGAMTYQVDSRILAARGRTRAAGFAGVVGLVVVVLLDLLMIPTFGLKGAAAASAIAYIAMGAVAARACSKSAHFAGHEGLEVNPELPMTSTTAPIRVVDTSNE
jgi:Na+-driven multidrug efflux pump